MVAKRVKLGDPLTGEVRVTMVWERKARRGDIDNRLKCLLDSLQGLAYLNDRQVVEIHASVVSGREDRVLVTVEEV